MNFFNLWALRDGGSWNSPEGCDSAGLVQSTRINPEAQKYETITMLGASLSDQIPGGPNLTLTPTLNSNQEFSEIKPDTDIVPKMLPVYMI